MPRPKSTIRGAGSKMGAPPILDHPTDAPTAFSPESLQDAVRRERGLPNRPVPGVCVLDFDGDLTDWLVSHGRARVWDAWACFHTTMYAVEVGGTACGVVPRTIGGPYAVLVAEQMAASGARVVLGVTSAGRVASDMPLPGLVVVTGAVRDEGTSYHYLPASWVVRANPRLAKLLASELGKQRLPVRSGRVWTTDAPYRETRLQLEAHAKSGVLAVEMQAASLLAFSRARGLPAGVVAHVTNSADESERGFDKGETEYQAELLRLVCSAGLRFVSGKRTRDSS